MDGSSPNFHRIIFIPIGNLNQNIGSIEQLLDFQRHPYFCLWPLIDSLASNRVIPLRGNSRIYLPLLLVTCYCCGMSPCATQQYLATATLLHVQKHQVVLGRLTIRAGRPEINFEAIRKLFSGRLFSGTSRASQVGCVRKLILTSEPS